jgi:hypothetical protein
VIVTRAGVIAVQSRAVSDKDARFRRLAPPSGDLFAHFGVALEVDATEPLAPAPRVAAGCSHCGWFVDVGAGECPICAKPRVAAGPP